MGKYIRSTPLSIEKRNEILDAWNTKEFTMDELAILFDCTKSQVNRCIHPHDPVAYQKKKLEAELKIVDKPKPLITRLETKARLQLLLLGMDPKPVVEETIDISTSDSIVPIVEEIINLSTGESTDESIEEAFESDEEYYPLTAELDIPKKREAPKSDQPDVEKKTYKPREPLIDLILPPKCSPSPVTIEAKAKMLSLCSEEIKALLDTLCQLINASNYCLKSILDAPEVKIGGNRNLSRIEGVHERMRNALMELSPIWKIWEQMEK